MAPWGYDDGWVEFNSLINPILDKAGSHIVGIAQLLQQPTKTGNIIDTTGRDFSLLLLSARKDLSGQFLNLLLEFTVLWRKMP